MKRSAGGGGGGIAFLARACLRARVHASWARGRSIIRIEVLPGPIADLPHRSLRFPRHAGAREDARVPDTRARASSLGINA